MIMVEIAPLLTVNMKKAAANDYYHYDDAAQTGTLSSSV